jgi:Sec-independent protein translocase protein TatA
MEIFGIGPLEFLLIVVIMLIVLGPKEMVATAGKIGRFVRQVIRSPMWASVMQTSKDVRDLPTKIIRKAGLEQDIAQIKEVAKAPGLMMADAAKQLKVEMDPIQLPQIPNPLTTPFNSPNTQNSPVSASVSSVPASSAMPTPLEMDPVTPGAVESHSAAAPLEIQETPPYPLAEEIVPPQVLEPPNLPNDQIVDENAVPLIIDSGEPTSSIQPVLDASPTPKRRTRRSKAAPVDSSQDQGMPLASESLSMLNPASSPENGGSAS